MRIKTAEFREGNTNGSSVTLPSSFPYPAQPDCTRKPGHIPVAESATSYLASIQSENHKHYTNVNPSNCGTSYLLCGHSLPLSKVQEGMGNTSQSS